MLVNWWAYWGGGGGAYIRGLIFGGLYSEVYGIRVNTIFMPPALVQRSFFYSPSSERNMSLGILPSLTSVIARLPSSSLNLYRNEIKEFDLSKNCGWSYDC